MELNTQAITTPPRPAATVVMLRDVAAKLEVFLLKRHGLSDVLGGAYVFPGGKMDQFDSDLDADRHLDVPLRDLHASLNEPDIDERTAGGLYVAALREVFEESGILYAQGAGTAEASQAHALLREAYSFEEALAMMRLRLEPSRLIPWVRWVTPMMSSVMNKRFDTRFFISQVPGNQIAKHDNHEATESVWLTPRAALEQYRDGLIELAPPQIMSLAHLSRYASVAEALGAARSRKPPIVQPEPYDNHGVRTLCYPGDERHPVKQAAFPGPSRLIHHNKRFVPVDGFEALFE